MRACVSVLPTNLQQPKQRPSLFGIGLLFDSISSKACWCSESDLPGVGNDSEGIGNPQGMVYRGHSNSFPAYQTSKKVYGGGPTASRMSRRRIARQELANGLEKELGWSYNRQTPRTARLLSVPLQASPKRVPWKK